MGNICTSCNVPIEDPKKPEDIDEKCDDCKTDEKDASDDPAME